MSVGQHAPLQAKLELGGDLGEDEDDNPGWLREWGEKQKRDSEWEKRHEERWQRIEEKLRNLGW